MCSPPSTRDVLIPRSGTKINLLFLATSLPCWVAKAPNRLYLHLTSPLTLTPPLVNIQAAERVDYYALLGVERDADADEITRAWRRLVLLHHPDKQPASGSSQAGSDVSSLQPKGDIRLVNEARWVLGDSDRRKEWEEAFFDGTQCSGGSEDTQAELKSRPRGGAGVHG